MVSSNDFSLFALFTAGLAALASAQSWTQPVGPVPVGNPTSHPEEGEIVPVGSPYTITWDPTTEGTITILLLRGPSENVVPLYPIAQAVPNTGTYDWTPSADLEPDTLRYGIQLIVDANGQYQYSPQFGISNPSYTSVATSIPATTASGTAYPTETFPSIYPTTTGAYNTTILTHPYTTTTYVAPTGSMPVNSSVVYPTVSMTVPTSLFTTGTPTGAESTGLTLPTGAAGKVGMSVAGAVAGVAAVVFAF
ncbi:hypothetical protein M501DRAFT_991006 [Patellaria atrata CBS 101060]|uniref:Yeast cell wall synthesis Kre9/Knh1-like N-terminal domain-containing protein n=1 Tax=Patellaria atrata CBS 101060 TaxID=1346257 RepID=A0A9P4VRL5_9PEZI|nr:hypothetical protein M501DRAFT_991006 [Patellaria atrata CBS 101060]